MSPALVVSLLVEETIQKTMIGNAVSSELEERVRWMESN